MNKDLTVGNPEKVLWRFCLPLFGSVIFQQLYNLADSWVAGNFINQNALAAVGNSYEITLIFIAFAFGCNIGCSVITSRFFGAKNYGKMKTAISTSLITSGAICGVLMLLGLIFGGFLLNAIHTPANLMADSKLYLDIYIYGLPFVFFYNITTGIFSALGDSKTPFIFLIISSTSNILVDILFVKYTPMQVDGVAWATFLCQGLSCIASMIVLFIRLYKMHLKESFIVFSLEMLKSFLAIAVPSILQQSFISLGNIIIQGVINNFGSDVIAGYAAGVKLNNLVITSYTTLGNGISNFASQNLGAGKNERIKDGFKAGIKMVWLLTLPFFIIYMLLTKYMVAFFIDEPTVEAIAAGSIYLRILAPFYFVVSVKLISDGVLRGGGLMKQFMVGTFTDLILRVVLAILFAKTILGSTGIWCAWPIGWCIATVISVFFYKTSLGRNSKTP